MRGLIALTWLGACALAAADLRFTRAEGGEFRFDTGLLRGNLREGGKSQGLGAVVHIPSGALLTRSMGLAGHYRVFTTNHRYGAGAWFWPSEATLRDDGSVEVRWPAAEDRPFEMSALYRWSGPGTLDVETTVRAREDLPDFESFLASYVSPQFTQSLVYSKERPGGGGGPAFVAAEQSYGVWQMFPRDKDAVRMIQDGRWKFPPSPVDWVIRQPFAEPLGVRRDPQTGLALVVMAHPGDSFAVATPHQTETHYSMYLSQFGRTLKAGQTARARARIVVQTAPNDEDVLKLYREFTRR